MAKVQMKMPEDFLMKVSRLADKTDEILPKVLEAGADKREVYLPEGDNWVEHAIGKHYAGGQTVTAEAPIDIIPVFVREGAQVAGLNA